MDFDLTQWLGGNSKGIEILFGVSNLAVAGGSLVETDDSTGFSVGLEALAVLFVLSAAIFSS